MNIFEKVIPAESFLHKNNRHIMINGLSRYVPTFYARLIALSLTAIIILLSVLVFAAFNASSLNAVISTTLGL